MPSRLMSKVGYGWLGSIAHNTGEGKEGEEASSSYQCNWVPKRHIVYLAIALRQTPNDGQF